MGRKKTAADEVAPVKEEKPKETEPTKKEEEDTPVVKELKAVDDKYLEVEREYERRLQELRRQYREKQAPLLADRQKVLADASKSEEGAAGVGTPAVKSFWLKALKNLPQLADEIEPHDLPVLEYIKDITTEDVDAEDSDKGFKLLFHFAENPYFTEEVLTKEFHTNKANPYNGEVEATEIKCSEISWKPGKDVTVELVKPKVKGGGAKKKKAKATEEPRDSFFRRFFKNLKQGMEIPDDVNFEDAMQMCEGGDEESLMNLLMENDHEVGTAVRESLIPFAVRWYTGEAVPEGYEDDDDDEDEEEESEDDDDDDSDEDSDDEPPAKGKAAAKKKAGGKQQQGGADKPKPEECKQQ